MLCFGLFCDHGLRKTSGETREFEIITTIITRIIIIIITIINITIIITTITNHHHNWTRQLTRWRAESLRLPGLGWTDGLHYATRWLPP